MTDSGESFLFLAVLISLQVMSAVPSTSQAVADCNRTLTAHELYQVVIG